MKKIFIAVALMVVALCGFSFADNSYTLTADTNTTTVYTGDAVLTGGYVCNNSTQDVVVLVYDNATLKAKFIADANTGTPLPIEDWGIEIFFDTSIKIVCDQVFTTVQITLGYKKVY